MIERARVLVYALRLDERYNLLFQAAALYDRKDASCQECSYKCTHMRISSSLYRYLHDYYKELAFWFMHLSRRREVCLSMGVCEGGGVRPPPRERVSRAAAEGRRAECVCEAESEL